MTAAPASIPPALHFATDIEGAPAKVGYRSDAEQVNEVNSRFAWGSAWQVRPGPPLSKASCDWPPMFELGHLSNLQCLSLP